ncbi:cupredoxin domain-containing protein [Yoonia sp. 2307UL14-13]|uniref:cupredoxin domain-containing protein n=1 Tax=Yoonia sp. 2307UL14-13 TaxID=3126506 RepID=UPI0030B4F00F
MSNITRRMALRLAVTAAAAPLAAKMAAADGHATTHTVAIRDFAFAPANLTISAGDTVRFVNEDSAPHTATADNGSFDTGRLSGGQAASLKFSSAGTFSYFCAVHPNMKGSITVA